VRTATTQPRPLELNYDGDDDDAAAALGDSSAGRERRALPARCLVRHWPGSVRDDGPLALPSAKATYRSRLRALAVRTRLGEPTDGAEFGLPDCAVVVLPKNDASERSQRISMYVTPTTPSKRS
jgi:hypothetical protein